MNGILDKILILIKIISTNISDFQIVTKPKKNIFIFFINNSNLTNII